MESGPMVWSIYCAHMAPKWSCVLDSQPKQGRDMSVEAYYDQFFNWKKKLEEVNYICDEGWYIEDFLCGLKIGLVVRVWVYKGKPLTLYGAFCRAQFEEMLSWKELNADKVFEEMSHPDSANTVETMVRKAVSDQRTDNSAPGVLDKMRNSAPTGLPSFSCSYVNEDEAYSPALEALIWLFEEDEQLPPLNWEDVGDAHLLVDKSPDTHLLEKREEKVEGYSMGTTLQGRELLGDEVRQPHLLIMRNIKADHQLVDKMPEQTLAEQNNEKCELNISHIMLVPRLDFELWLGELLRFKFDPGGSPWYNMSCHSSSSYVVSYIWCMLLHNVAENIKLNNIMDGLVELLHLQQIFVDDGRGVVLTSVAVGVAVGIAELIAGEQIEGNGGLESCEASTVCLSKDSINESGVIGVDLRSYVWKPGQYMIPYILEDKGVVKRNGIGVRLTLTQDEASRFTFDSGGEMILIAMEDRELDAELRCSQVLMFVFDPGGKPKFPPNFEETTWTTLKSDVVGIFLQQPDLCDLEKLYQAVHSLCIHKMGGSLYQRIEKECEAHISAALQSLVGQSDDLVVFLSLVEKSWQDFCEQMSMIHGIALVLDRTYMKQTPNVRLLWDMELHLFRKHFALASKVENKTVVTVFGPLKLIDSERLGEAVDRTLLNHLLKMFSAL